MLHNKRGAGKKKGSKSHTQNKSKSEFNTHIVSSDFFTSQGFFIEIPPRAFMNNTEIIRAELPDTIMVINSRSFMGSKI